MDGWNTSCFLGPVLFSGAKNASFRECISFTGSGKLRWDRINKNTTKEMDPQLEQHDCDVSNEKNLRCLGWKRGWNPTRLCGDYKEAIIRIPLKTTSIMESKSFFFFFSWLMLRFSGNKSRSLLFVEFRASKWCVWMPTSMTFQWRRIIMLLSYLWVWCFNMSV